ncbi:hypothetical protein QVD17_02390 [Tagetes erecta]|uniref:Uncharacterized protein n=1 Tax=Tagetes erecta TaxID=13708 RepID=A0AAD8P7Q9_TARER|nr:hypothetical protein QVD17_02390 [Tagetes erecta]
MVLAANVRVRGGGVVVPGGGGCLRSTHTSNALSVNIHMWQVDLDRIATRVARSHRNIPLDNVDCVLWGLSHGRFFLYMVECFVLSTLPNTPQPAKQDYTNQVFKTLLAQLGLENME